MFDPYIDLTCFFVPSVWCSRFLPMIVLKVGSCPSDENFVRICFCPFLCSRSIQIILFSESVPDKKTARFC